MANEYSNDRDDNISFKQICLGFYKKILELSSHEYCGGYWQKTGYNPATNQETSHYVSDKRKEFIQSVETLCLALTPHFDEEMEKPYKELMEEAEKIDKEYQTDEGFIKMKGVDHIKHSIKLLEVSKKLFKELSGLMFRLDYFKGSAYTEEED